MLTTLLHCNRVSVKHVYWDPLEINTENVTNHKNHNLEKLESASKPEIETYSIVWYCVLYDNLLEYVWFTAILHNPITLYM